jgi:hypothetical protein
MANLFGIILLRIFYREFFKGKLKLKYFIIELKKNQS